MTFYPRVSPLKLLSKKKSDNFFKKMVYRVGAIPDDSTWHLSGIAKTTFKGMHSLFVFTV